jgi:hypothetical protein
MILAEGLGKLWDRPWHNLRSLKWDHHEVHT